MDFNDDSGMAQAAGGASPRTPRVRSSVAKVTLHESVPRFDGRGSTRHMRHGQGGIPPLSKMEPVRGGAGATPPRANASADRSGSRHTPALTASLASIPYHSSTVSHVVGAARRPPLKLPPTDRLTVEDAVLLMSEMEQVMDEMEGKLASRTRQINDFKHELELTQQQLMEQSQKCEDAAAAHARDKESMQEAMIKLVNNNQAVLNSERDQIKDMQLHHRSDLMELEAAHDRAIAQLKAECDDHKAHLQAQLSAAGDTLSAKGHANALMETMLSSDLSGVAGTSDRPQAVWREHPLDTTTIRHLETTNATTSSELDDVLAEVHRLHDIEQQLCDKDVELSIQTDKAQRLEAQLASRRSWVLSRAEREQAARERNPQWRPPARHAQTPVKNFSEFQSLLPGETWD